MPMQIEKVRFHRRFRLTAERFELITLGLVLATEDQRGLNSVLLELLRPVFVRRDNADRADLAARSDVEFVGRARNPVRGACGKAISDRERSAFGLEL
jgi:hypothetical protein